MAFGIWCRMACSVIMIRMAFFPKGKYAIVLTSLLLRLGPSTQLPALPGLLERPL